MSCLQLNQREIRVLDISNDNVSQPAEEKFLRGTLRVINLDEDCHFTALSYVWGSYSKPSRTLFCNDVQIDITDNAHDALCQLRNTLGSFTIWVDAICIDQNNDTEKVAQINLMGDVYSKAQITYVWLGLSTPKSDRAMDFLSVGAFFDYYFVDGDPAQGELTRPQYWNALRSWYPQLWKRYLRMRRERRKGGSANILSLPTTNKSKQPFIQTSDLADVLSRAWVKRIWTYQEILLSSNPKILCGTRSLSWRDFTLMLVYVDYTIDRLLPESHLSVLLPTWKKLAMIREEFQRKRSVSIETAPKLTADLKHELLGYQSFVHRLCQAQSRVVYLIFLPVVALSWFSTIAFVMVYSINRSANTDLHSLQAAYADLGQVMTDSQLTAFCLMLCDTSDCGPFVTRSVCHFAVVKPYLTMMVISIVVGILTTVNMVPASISRVRSAQGARGQQILRKELKDNLVDALCTRNATKAEDMAYGIRAILEEQLGHSLPKIDINASRVQVFRDLTINLVELGHLARVLVAAANHNNANQPSWIPDWSQHFLQFWTSPWSAWLDATPGSECYFERHIGKEDVMTLRGRTVCTVDRTYCLQATIATYNETERNKHLHNLGLMLDFVRRTRGISAPQHDVRALLSNMYEPGLHEEQMNSLHLHAYLLFLNRSCRLDPEKVLQLLLKKGGISFWHTPPLKKLRTSLSKVSHTAVFAVHIAICNNLVRTERMFFTCSDLVRRCESPTRDFIWRPIRLNKLRHPDSCTIVPYHIPILHPLTHPAARNVPIPSAGVNGIGICSVNAKYGDTVILASGVVIPLIVRTTEDDKFRLISPAHVAGLMRGLGWFCTPRYGDKIPYEYFNIC